MEGEDSCTSIWFSALPPAPSASCTSAGAGVVAPAPAAAPAASPAPATVSAAAPWKPSKLGLGRGLGSGLGPRPGPGLGSLSGLLVLERLQGGDIGSEDGPRLSLVLGGPSTLCVSCELACGPVCGAGPACDACPPGVERGLWVSFLGRSRVGEGRGTSPSCPAQRIPFPSDGEEGAMACAD